nr:PREDICTED: neuropeptide FF receptor 1-like [Lepisosteus oculatus]
MPAIVNLLFESVSADTTICLSHSLSLSLSPCLSLRWLRMPAIVNLLFESVSADTTICLSHSLSLSLSPCLSLRWLRMPAIVNLLFESVSADTTISFSLVLPLFSVLALLAGVGGHLLVWLVLLRQRQRRARPSSVLLLNLSLADLGALLALPCVLLTAAGRGWRLGGHTCVFLAFSTSLTAGVDIFSLAAMSVLRHRIVTAPASPPLRPWHLAAVLAVIWLVAVTMALPKVTYVQFDSHCTWAVGRGQWLGFLVPAFLVYYVAPLVTIAVNCGRIVRHLRHAPTPGGTTFTAARRNKKATALLIGSTLAFALSWLPYYALEFVNLPPPLEPPGPLELLPTPFPPTAAPHSPPSGQQNLPALKVICTFIITTIIINKTAFTIITIVIIS